MTEHADHDLGERFHALRRADAAIAPAFHGTLAAARARGAGKPQRRALGFAVAGIIVASVAVAVLAIRHGLPNDLATVRLTTPTDFLLALPNEDLLRTVPQLGRVTFTLDRRNP
jgi:hypothetical protein